MMTATKDKAFEADVRAVLDGWQPVSTCTMGDLYRGGFGGRWDDEAQKRADIWFLGAVSDALRNLGRSATIRDLPEDIIMSLARRTRRLVGQWWSLAGDDSMTAWDRIDRHWAAPREAAARANVAQERQRERMSAGAS